MKLLLLPVAALLLLTGCGPSEDEREIKQQLAEIKAALAQLSQPPPRAAAEREKTIDTKVVELPKLPDNPTAKDVKEYAGKLRQIREDNSCWVDDKTFSVALAAIPPGYIIELAPYLDNSSFIEKIPDWLVDQDKKRILQKLPEEPLLLFCLRYMPYTYQDLRGPLLALLQGKKNAPFDCIAQAYIKMLVRDPEVRGQIKQLMFQNPDLYFFADAFAERDGNPLIYDQVWKSYILTKQKIPLRVIYDRLAGGKSDAIGVLIENRQEHCDCHDCAVFFPILKATPIWHSGSRSTKINWCLTPKIESII